MEGILKSAINIVEKKYTPTQPSTQVFVPEEQYKSLYDMLQVWDEARTDEDVQSKTKFIYDILGENPRDGLMNVITEIGITPQGQNRVDRVYKYLRLKNQANKLMSQYEHLQGELNGFRTR